MCAAQGFSLALSGVCVKVVSVPPLSWHTGSSLLELCRCMCFKGCSSVSRGVQLL